MREKLKERAHDRHQTRLDEMVKDKVKMYFDLMASMGAESTNDTNKKARTIFGGGVRTE